MIDWSTVAPTLREVISGLALAKPVTPSFEGRWAEGQAEFVHPEVQREIILRVSRVADFSADRVYSIVPHPEIPGREALEERIVGMKEFGLEVRVESHEHVPDEGRWALSMAGRIRTGLLFSRSVSKLLSVGVGLIEIGATHDLAFTFDKRRFNAAVFEASFYGAFCLADPVPIDWFERVELTSRIQNAAGVELPSPPNITGRVVPPWPSGSEPDPSP